jgi:hypothetical protein
MMRGEGHVARTVEMRNIYKILFGKPTGTRHPENTGADEKIISEWI